MTALPDGRTRLEGTTWYEQSIWPQAYWQPWSDYLIHSIHERVLQHIKAEAEHEILDPAAARSAQGFTGAASRHANSAASSWR